MIAIFKPFRWLVTERIFEVVSCRSNKVRPQEGRREDIFELALYFLNLHAQRTGKLVTHLDPEAVEALVAYDWPGNIRELENVLERAVVLADGPSVTLEDLPVELRQPGAGGFVRGLRLAWARSRQTRMCCQPPPRLPPPLGPAAAESAWSSDAAVAAPA